MASVGSMHNQSPSIHSKLLEQNIRKKV